MGFIGLIKLACAAAFVLSADESDYQVLSRESSFPHDTKPARETRALSRCERFGTAYGQSLHLQGREATVGLLNPFASNNRDHDDACLSIFSSALISFFSNPLMRCRARYT